MRGTAIHATPVDANLVVWGENWEQQTHQGGPDEMIPFHPTALTQQNLEQTVLRIGRPFRESITRANANAWLPTVGNEPIPSNPSRRAGLIDEEAPTRPWAVPAVRVMRRDIPRFLTRPTNPPPDPPCNHATAVHLHAGLRSMRNPALLLAARGMNLELLQEVATESAQRAQQRSETGPELGVRLPGQQGDSMAAAEFWGDQYVEELRNLRIAPPARPNQPAETIHRLGPFPDWQSDPPFIETMERIYQANDPHITEIVEDAGYLRRGRGEKDQPDTTARIETDENERDERQYEAA